jgi:hypothetical protein
MHNLLYILLFFILIFFQSLVSDNKLIVSFLSDSKTRDEDRYNVGTVEAGYEVFFDNQGSIKEPKFVKIDDNTEKEGIYEINITESENDYFIQNLRINVIVKSDVETYIRIKLIHTLVYTYTNSSGVITESPVAIQEDLILNYHEFDPEIEEDGDYWIKADEDGYYYLTKKVIRESEEEERIINFIIDYFEGISYNPRTTGYTIQLGIELDAVQANSGPKEKWGLDNPPWGGNW